MRQFHERATLVLGGLLLALALTAPATAGCVSETGAGGCTDGFALDFPRSVVASPDGKHVYVASGGSGAIAVFARSKATGGLTEIQCANNLGSDGCIAGPGLGSPTTVAMSPDGKHVYTVSFFSSSMAFFARSKSTGALTNVGCKKDPGSSLIAACDIGRALLGPLSVEVSNDGKHVYVASFASSAVAVFARNKTTGGLTQNGCVSDANPLCDLGTTLVGPNSVTVSRDGRHVYAAYTTGGGVAAFARNKTTGLLTQVGCVNDAGTGGCVDGTALALAQFVTLSRDGRHVYVASRAPTSAVTIFARSKTTGLLTQVGCVSETATAGCTDVTALGGPISVAPSPDGKHVYVASDDSGAIAVFARNKTTGLLAQLGCVSETGAGGCTDGFALDGPTSLALTPDGKHLYVASRTSDAIAFFARNKITGLLTE